MLNFKNILLKNSVDDNKDFSNKTAQIDDITRIAAILSDAAYNSYENSDINSLRLPCVSCKYGKWFVVNQRHDKTCGFDAILFYNPVDTRFVLAFRGTELGFNLRGLKDIFTDLLVSVVKERSEKLEFVDIVQSLLDDFHSIQFERQHRIH